ncbi:MAG: hypothetical protein U5R31_12580 [Acidimicrobiia bacterium]|nr:hypothetical protein [Acidimicrobiia bacterium]
MLDALGDEPATLEHLAVRTGRALGTLTGQLHELRAGGLVAEEGGWYERVRRADRER